MCKPPEVYANMVMHGNGRYYVKSVVTVSCSGHGYGFMEGGTQRTLVCLQNRQWHTTVNHCCQGI